MPATETVKTNGSAPAATKLTPEQIAKIRESARANLAALREAGALDADTSKDLRSAMRAPSEGGAAAKLRAAYLAALAPAWETWQAGRAAAGLTRLAPERNPHTTVKTYKPRAVVVVTADQKKALGKALTSKGQNAAKLAEVLGEGWNSSTVVRVASEMVKEKKAVAKQMEGVRGMYSKEYSLVK